MHGKGYITCDDSLLCPRMSSALLSYSFSYIAVMICYCGPKYRHLYLAYCDIYVMVRGSSPEYHHLYLHRLWWSLLCCRIPSSLLVVKLTSPWWFVAVAQNIDHHRCLHRSWWSLLCSRISSMLILPVMIATVFQNIIIFAYIACDYCNCPRILFIFAFIACDDRYCVPEYHHLYL